MFGKSRFGWVIGLVALMVVFWMRDREGGGREAPDFRLTSYLGKSLTLSRLEGEKGAMLVFLASWCEVCNSEIPSIRRFADESAGDVFVCGIDIEEDRQTVSAFAYRKSIDFPLLLDGDGSVAKRYRVISIPTFIGIDKSGRVVYRGHELPRDTESLIDKLNS